MRVERRPIERDLAMRLDDDDEPGPDWREAGSARGMRPMAANTSITEQDADERSSRSQVFMLVGLFALLSALAVTGCWAVYALQRQRMLGEIDGLASGRVLYQKRAIVLDLGEVAADVKILSEQPSVRSFLDRSGADAKRQIQQQFLLFSRRRGLYDQIRILDESGMEIIRVNYNKGRPAVVPADKLQSKKGRYYFDDTFRLDSGQIFVSPLDLNVERGQIEQPLKPMMRFGTPLFDGTGKKRGILLLNYRGARVLSHFAEAAFGGRGDQSMLLNSQGYWLESPRDEDEWGFMFRNDRRFGSAYPEAWRSIDLPSWDLTSRRSNPHWTKVQ